MYFCKGQYPSVNVPKCWMQLSWCAWWESLPKMKRGRAVPREQRAQSHWGWSVHLCLYFDLLKHLITSFPFTSITSADPKPALVWWCSCFRQNLYKVFSFFVFSLCNSPLPSPLRGNLEGLLMLWWESPPPLPPFKTWIDQLDRDSAGFMCVFPSLICEREEMGRRVRVTF